MAATAGPTVDVRRARDRFHTQIGWLDSWHSFSFGEHYDPANTGFGVLVVSNDDTVAPASGFGRHAHRDMEIVTWVLSGRLEHRDSQGNHDVIAPGLAQRMSAGTGISHSEMNPDPRERVHFVQMWVVPDTAGVDPGYEQVDVTAELDRGGLVTVASGATGDGAIGIRQAAATLYAARLAPATTVTVPAAAFAHVFAATGTADLEGVGPLRAGDAARIVGAEASTITAGTDGAEVLVWDMDRA